MESFKDQFRRHSQATSLSPEQIERITGACRGAIATHRQTAEARGFRAWPRRWKEAISFKGKNRPPLGALALPAGAIAGIALAAYLIVGGFAHQPAAVPLAQYQEGIVDFFEGDYNIPVVTADKTLIRAHFLEEGLSPAHRLPGGRLGALESYGCKVFEIAGRTAYLHCLWFDRSKGELVHLFISEADTVDFTGSREPVLHARRGWAFATWTEGGLIYNLASPIPPERLHSLLLL